MAASFITSVSSSSISNIRNSAEDTIFVMVQTQPARMFDPEDQFDLVPHKVKHSGSYTEMAEYYDSLLARIRAYDKMDEHIEFLMEEEGKDYSKFVFYNGPTAVVCTICGKEKALALAL